MSGAGEPTLDLGDVSDLRVAIVGSSMGGITARRAQRQHEKLVKKDAGRSFMGRPPDRRTPPAEVEEGAA